VELTMPVPINVLAIQSNSELTLTLNVALLELK